MVDIKVGQTIRLYASVWDFCGQYSQSLYIHDVEINTPPTILPPSCLNISGIGISFSLGSTSSSVQCQTCSPDASYTNMGTAYTDTNGVAYLDYTVTQNDYAAWQTAQAAGASVRVLACITDPKGQTVLNNACSDIVTVLPTVNIAPTYAIEFDIYENASGILSLISPHIALLTSTFNTFITAGAGWIVDHTVVDVQNSKITLYMSDIGSWSTNDLVALLAGVIAIVVSAVIIATTSEIVIPVAVLVLAVAGIIAVAWKVYDLVNNVQILTHEVQNFETKDQNGTKLDQMVGKVEDAYQNSPKTTVDCQNRLNGLKLSYEAYFDTMAKDFPALYTEATKRSFDASATKSISDFNAGTISCDVAAGQIQSSGSVGRSDVNTNFTNVYTDNNPYVKPPPNPADCWIPGPTVDKCLLSAYTGWWLVGAGTLLFVAWGAYYLATREPRLVRSVVRGARRTTKAVGKETRMAARAAYTLTGTAPAPAPARAPSQPTG